MKNNPFPWQEWHILFRNSSSWILFVCASSVHENLAIPARQNPTCQIGKRGLFSQEVACRQYKKKKKGGTIMQYFLLLFLKKMAIAVRCFLSYMNLFGPHSHHTVILKPVSLCFISLYPLCGHKDIPLIFSTVFKFPRPAIWILFKKN